MCHRGSFRREERQARHVTTAPPGPVLVRWRRRLRVVGAQEVVSHCGGNRPLLRIAGVWRLDGDLHRGALGPIGIEARRDGNGHLVAARGGRRRGLGAWLTPAQEERQGEGQEAQPTAGPPAPPRPARAAPRAPAGGVPAAWC